MIMAPIEPTSPDGEISTHGVRRAPDALSANPDDAGLVSYDPSYANTAACSVGSSPDT